MRRATNVLPAALIALVGSGCASEHAADDAGLDASLAAGDAPAAPDTAPDDAFEDLYTLCITQCGRRDALGCPGERPPGSSCEMSCTDELSRFCCRTEVQSLLDCFARTSDADFCSIGTSGPCAAELAADFWCSPAPDAGC